MIKRNRPSKLPSQAIENNIVNNENATDSKPIKKKQKCNSSQQHQKPSAKRKLNLEDTNKSQQNPENLHVPLKQNEEMYKHQIEQLSLILKQSLHSPTLTQEELRILFMKYKYDGHYRSNKNLPSFKSLLSDKQGTLNDENCSLQTQHNLEYNSYEQQEINSEKIFNKMDDKYHCIQSSDVAIKNYNQTLANYDTQSFGNTNVFNNIQNIDESRSNFGINDISNKEGDFYPRNIANTGNIYPQENHGYQYDNFKDINENSQQNEKYRAIHFDPPQNLNIYNDFLVQKGDNNMSLIEENNNYQVSESEHLICVPEINNLEWYHTMTNDSVEQNIFNTRVHENVYPAMNNDYDTINNSSHIKQDFYTNTSDLSCASDNFIPDTNLFLPSFTNIVD